MKHGDGTRKSSLSPRTPQNGHGDRSLEQTYGSLEHVWDPAGVQKEKGMGGNVWTEGALVQPRRAGLSVLRSQHNIYNP